LVARIYYLYKKLLKEKRALMDAPISITLAHLIIIWTLSIVLLAWMLIFAFLALRSVRPKGTTQDEILMKSDTGMSNLHTPRATVSPQFFIHQTELISARTYNRSISTTTGEIPATPIM
jgi:hypothetical protein